MNPTPLHPSTALSRPAKVSLRSADQARRPLADTTRHARRWAAGCLAAILLAGACSTSEDANRTTGPGPTGEAPEALLGFTPAPLQWESCAGRLQCASLDVPLNYDDPAGPTISLALAMLPATDPDARIGRLITNPGGPGGSGVDFLGNDGPFNDEINRQFDLVAWDPRASVGPSRSTAATS